jgi:hypothetical protein
MTEKLRKNVILMGQKNHVKISSRVNVMFRMRIWQNNNGIVTRKKDAVEGDIQENLRKKRR